MQAIPILSASEYEAIKSKKKVAWGTGAYGRVRPMHRDVGESLCEAVDLRSSDRVLDVAAGNGNASLAAARRFASVTSTDYVPALLEQGLRRAQADGLSFLIRVADAENLPFKNAEFD